jgi:hypothetical protein
MESKRAWIKPAVIMSFSEETLRQTMSNKELLARGGSFSFDWSEDFGADWPEDFTYDNSFPADWPEDFVENGWPIDWPGDA